MKAAILASRQHSLKVDSAKFEPSSTPTLFSPPMFTGFTRF
jgi:hypothetical protein